MKRMWSKDELGGNELFPKIEILVDKTIDADGNLVDDEEHPFTIKIQGNYLPFLMQFKAKINGDDILCKCWFSGGTENSLGELRFTAFPLNEGAYLNSFNAKIGDSIYISFYPENAVQSFEFIEIRCASIIEWNGELNFFEN